MSWLRVRPLILNTGLAGIALVSVVGVIVSVVARDVSWFVVALGVDGILLMGLFAKSLHNLAAEQDIRLQDLVGRVSALSADAAYVPGRPLDLLRRDLQRDASALHQLNGLIPAAGPVPAPGGWAATPDTLLALVARVLDADSVETVVECGSGTSTVWLALALRKRGSGRLVSLENDPEYARATRQALETFGLLDWVDVRDAPLEPIEMDDGSQGLWYDPTALEGVQGVSLLFVDGPPAHFGPRIRSSALPQLASRLAPGAWVVLDDVDRPEEQEIAAAWLSHTWNGGTLVRRATTDRAVILEVQR